MIKYTITTHEVIAEREGVNIIYKPKHQNWEQVQILIIPEPSKPSPELGEKLAQTKDNQSIKKEV